MVTRSDGCGMTGRSSLTSWYWEQARWNEDTAMQDKCFGWACSRETLVSSGHGRQTSGQELIVYFQGYQASRAALSMQLEKYEVHSGPGCCWRER